MQGQTSNEVIFTEVAGVKGNIGKIVLNRPAALNALTESMIKAIYAQLIKWATNHDIYMVLIKSNNERAFCAGGDIRYIYENRDSLENITHPFFCGEYKMNELIFHFPKPYLALLDGLTMGGGVGVSLPGSHRVATEQLKWAMPETLIGFFPDIGAGYFLSRLPHHIGYYLGLTGHSIHLPDALALGLVDHHIPAERFAAVEQALDAQEWNVQQDVWMQLSHLLTPFSEPPSLSHDESLMLHSELIEQCFSQDSVEAIIQALENSQDQWGQETAALLLRRSPISLKVTLAHLRHCEKLSFSEVIAEDAKVAKNFLYHRDFYEGIRAAIIDKDRNPHWQPAHLTEITREQVEAFFK